MTAKRKRSDTVASLRRALHQAERERDAARQTLAVLLQPGLTDKELTDAAIAAAVGVIGSMIPANVTASDAGRGTPKTRKERSAVASPTRPASGRPEIQP